MMNILMLISIILGISAQDILKKIYNRCFGGTYFFVALSSFAAMLFFVIMGKDMCFDTCYLVYSMMFGVFYALSIVGLIYAIATGPLSLTALAVSFSLMLPTLYGLIFLNDPVGRGLIPGLILLVLSLIMVNRTHETARVSPKWFFFAFLAFLGNGMCSTVQKIQQMTFHGAYKNEFMIAALFFVTLCMGMLSFIAERKTTHKKIGISGIVCILNGFVNGIVNLFVMLLSARMPVSVMFPMISAGGLVVTYIISGVFYKEKLSRIQRFGFALGTLSVVFLSM